MARNNRRRSGGRGRNRGSGLYARPISEPCNFLEIDVNVNVGSQLITHAAVNTLLSGLVGVTNISKYRVSSLVFEPLNQVGGLARGTVHMGISGQEYLWSNLDKPLRIRLGKDYGDDGMWIVTDGAVLTDAALPGNEATGDSFVSLTVPDPGTDIVWATVLHIRFAWQDPQ